MKRLLKRPVRSGLLPGLALLLAIAAIAPAGAREGLAIPPPALDEPAPTGGGMATAVFAGGCFWGVQGVFQHVRGVANAVSGYAGGAAATAHYETVGAGDTGHAEAVQITYDPRQISYGKLLQIFFSAAHDPTQKNRQGPDVGPQYRSAVFARTPEQARLASAYVKQLDGARVYGAPLATTIERGKQFYPAEKYHQDYMTLNPRAPYIAYYDLPKLDHLKRLFPDLYREKPTLTSQAGG